MFQLSTFWLLEQEAENQKAQEALRSGASRSAVPKGGNVDNESKQPLESDIFADEVEKVHDFLFEKGKKVIFAFLASPNVKIGYFAFRQKHCR